MIKSIEQMLMDSEAVSEFHMNRRGEGFGFDYNAFSRDYYSGHGDCMQPHDSRYGLADGTGGRAGCGIGYGFSDGSGDLAYRGTGNGDEYSHGYGDDADLFDTSW